MSIAGATKTFVIISAFPTEPSIEAEPSQARRRLADRSSVTAIAGIESAF
jgi:hypothetical protein